MNPITRITIIIGWLWLILLFASISLSIDLLWVAKVSVVMTGFLMASWWLWLMGWVYRWEPSSRRKRKRTRH